MSLCELLRQAGICVPGWPVDPLVASEERIYRCAEEYLSVMQAWKATLSGKERPAKDSAATLINSLLEAGCLDPWETIVVAFLADVFADYGKSDGWNSLEIVSLVHCTPLTAAQRLAIGFLLAQASRFRELLMIMKLFLESQEASTSWRISCVLDIIGNLEPSKQLLVRKMSNASIELALDFFSKLTALVVKIAQYLPIDKGGLSPEVQDLRLQEFCLNIDEALQALEMSEFSIRDQCTSTPPASSAVHELPYYVCKDGLMCRKQMFPGDSFSADVYMEIFTFLAKGIKDRGIGLVREVKVVSSRLKRIFDPALYDSIADSITEMWHALGLRVPVSGLSLSFTDDLSMESVRENVIYIICSHVNAKELDFVRKIRASGSIAVGWLWDNHHHYATNFRLAKLLDVAIPAHYAGRGVVLSAQRCTTKPLPLATCQWSIPTFRSFQLASRKGDLRYLLIGRYSNWSVSPQRSERVNLLREIYEADPLFDFCCLDPEQMAFLGLSPLDNALQWSASLSSLTLPVRNDLSTRFFDSMLCGCVPIVDAEVSPKALDDLLPGIQRGRHYVVCDSLDHEELDCQIRKAATLRRENYDIRFNEFLLGHHTVEARLALIIHSALSACMHAL